MIKKTIILGTFIFLISLNLSSEVSSAMEIVKVYNYDVDSPLNLKKEKLEDSNEGPAVYNLTYLSPTGRKIRAYLTVPRGKGQFAGLIFMHWLGNPNGDYNEFLDEAKSLAGKGIVSILPNGYFPWWESQNGSANDTNHVISQIIELRRTLDVLLMQKEVDPKRIGFIGHDYGAMHGAVLSGIEKRITAYALMASTGSYSDWAGYFFSTSDQEKFSKYKEMMAAFDPLSYIPYTAPAKLFFQFAKTDNYVPKEKAELFFNTASEPKEIKWYETGHALNKEAMLDRDIWILDKLGMVVDNK